MLLRYEITCMSHGISDEAPKNIPVQGSEWAARSARSEEQAPVGCHTRIPAKIEIRQTIPYLAIRVNGISINSNIPPS